MYSAAFRHVPVNWIVGIMTIFSGVWNCISCTTERVWSFMNAIWYNIVGFDKYFIFMDDSPVPIPYWYYGGCPGDAAWLYDARNRIFFNCTDEANNKKAYLPVLSMDLNATFRNEDRVYDLSDWLSSVTFYTHDSSFPHPLQILSAWSLNSRMWPATKDVSNSSFNVIDGDTGDDETISLVQHVPKYYWHDYQHMSADEDEEEAEEEDEEEAEEEDEDEAEAEGTSEEEEEEAEGTSFPTTGWEFGLGERQSLSRTAGLPTSPVSEIEQTSSDTEGLIVVDPPVQLVQPVLETKDLEAVD
jgi:hypothetical protein